MTVHGLLRSDCFSARILIGIQQRMYPRFLSCTYSKKTGTHLLQNRMFCCLWKQSYAPSLPCDALFGLGSGNGACLEAGR